MMYQGYFCKFVMANTISSLAHQAKGYTSNSAPGVVSVYLPLHLTRLTVASHRSLGILVFVSTVMGQLNIEAGNIVAEADCHYTLLNLYLQTRKPYNYALERTQKGRRLALPEVHEEASERRVECRSTNRRAICMTS